MSALPVGPRVTFDTDISQNRLCMSQKSEQCRPTFATFRSFMPRRLCKVYDYRDPLLFRVPSGVAPIFCHPERE